MSTQQSECNEQPSCVGRRMDAAATTGTSYPFENIGDDLILSVFSFVATAPQAENQQLGSNNSDDEPSTLTNVLPQVSKLWNDLSQYDYLWKPLILKRLENEPELWSEGLWKLFRNDKPWEPRTKVSSFEDFLEQAREALGKISYKTIYRQVVSNHIHFTGPVFYMRGPVLLGDSYRLFMFEPRYRLLVVELLKDYPEEARKGGQIVPGPNRQPPLFIHANFDPFSPNTPACLVQITRCNISDRDGTADVMLSPICYVWMEKCWVRPNSFNLHYAQAWRMGCKATQEMQDLVNQETVDLMLGTTDYDYADTSDDELDEGDWDVDLRE